MSEKTAENRDLVKVATDQIESLAIDLKMELRRERDVEDAVKRLEICKQNLVEQLEILASLKAPTDLIKLYIETGGKVFTSKRVMVRDGQPLNYFTVGSINIMYENPLNLEAGFYRFVVMALPCEPAKKEKVSGAVYMDDDYGQRIDEDDLYRKGSRVR